MSCANNMLVNNETKTPPTTAPNILDYLHDDALFSIFEKCLSPKELSTLSLVCKRFHYIIFRKGDRLWELFANSIGLKKISEDPFPFRASFQLMREEKIEAKKFISQITDPFQKALEKIRLISAYPNENEIIEAKELISQIPSTFLKVLVLIELIKKIYPNETEIIEAKELISQISDPYHQTEAQIKLIETYPNEIKIIEIKNLLITAHSLIVIAQLVLAKADPTEENITKTKELFSQMPNSHKGQDSYERAKVLIELIKIYINQNKIIEAKDFISKVSDPYCRVLALIELLKAYPNEIEITEIKNTFSQIRSSTLQKEAQINLVKAYLYKNKIIEAKEIISQITDIYLKALAQIEFVKVFPTETEIKITKEFISQITDNPSCKTTAQVALVRAFFNKLKK